MVVVRLGPRKKRLAIAIVIAVLLLLLVSIVCLRRGPNVNSVLSRTGLACLPDSVNDVKMSRRVGLLHDVRITYIRFTASRDDIITFLQDSRIYELGNQYIGDFGRGFIIPNSFTNRFRSMLRRVLRIRSKETKHPSWWIKSQQRPGMLQYRREPERMNETIVVDCATNTVYIRLYNL